MTVHTAKGLEFPVVFITGLEERIFPHARSVDDDSAVEEERRLCYVAVTRARTQLHLSRVRRRRLSGQELPGIPSRFLRELPADSIDAIVMERPREYGSTTATARGRGPGAGAGTATTCRSTERNAPAPPRRLGGRPAAAPSAPRARPVSSACTTTATRARATPPACTSATSCATRSSASARCAAGSRPAPT